MIGQELEEIEKLGRDIRFKRQTIASSEEMLSLIRTKQNGMDIEFNPFQIHEIEIRGNFGNQFGGYCKINKDEIPMDLIPLFLEAVISKAQKELISLEKRFSSIKISMP